MKVVQEKMRIIGVKNGKSKTIKMYQQESTQ